MTVPHRHTHPPLTLDLGLSQANLNVLPSGGVSPSNAFDWLDAGAAVIGMGSNLVGKDIATVPDTPAHAKAQDEWEAKGQGVAQDLFRRIGARFSDAAP